MYGRGCCYTAVIQTPLGGVGLLAEPHLTQLKFLAHTSVPSRASASFSALRVAWELECYFKNPNVRFTVPDQISGTVFQKRVWAALVCLRAGETVTYGQLAKQLRTSARAIGNACRANPLPLLIPCHRVVAQHGLGGFCGERTESKTAIKQWLLNHEAGAVSLLRKSSQV